MPKLTKECENRSPEARKNMDSSINYVELVNRAMYYVVKEALLQTTKSGLQGRQHFLITFSTTADKVQIPKTLQEKYPEKLTIVLQHQFYDLEVYEDSFKVTLSFGGILETLFVPFSSISRFVDPSVPFHLCFQTYEEGQTKLFGIGLPAKAQQQPQKNTPSTASNSSKVISLDAFRKSREEDR